ncbi:MAG: hypothetical protein B7Z62_00225 [Deltaproteobacteria bacterium 37-65-8]|nr:MAG: hypothetical protein B7Z62_00225 [Deltaproteobacteria bacterium 37-65-8]
MRKHIQGKRRFQHYVDGSNVYKRAEVEKLMWEARLGDASDEEIASLVGLPVSGVRRALTVMYNRVATDGSLLARTWAVRQTMLLWSEVYEEAGRQWVLTKDPRYAAVMRGALADIRKIWGVDAPQRVNHAHIHTGVIHTELGRCTVEELELLRRLCGDGEVAGGCDSGEDRFGDGLPPIPGLLPPGNSGVG